MYAKKNGDALQLYIVHIVGTDVAISAKSKDMQCLVSL